MTDEPKNQARPFLKWAGGKRQLLDQFENLFPKDFNTYHEPMVGGGAVFFHLNPKKAVINDTNEDLMRAYRVVRDNADELIALLKKFKKKHEKEFYYKSREEFNVLKQKPNGDNAVVLTAHLIYLNRTCFNGLYRVNKKGGFNVPMGRYKNPKICDEENLRAVSSVLQNVEIKHGDFEELAKEVKKKDFVYFDPPYDPLNATSNFTQYTNDGFGEEGQERLAEVFKTISNKGAKVALSNSDTERVRKLYEGFTVHTVRASRSINSKASKRGKINELLITNY